MNRIHSSSRKIIIAARFILLGLVVFGSIMPVGAQAFQLPDFTATPELPTPTATVTLSPATPVNESDWLSFPSDASQLATDRPLALLAGNFINHGLVDASSCADGGMLVSGAASACGESVAHNAVIVWQNQFDAEILTVAQDSGVPPFILKNVFFKESQFWPATYHNPTYGGEYGLGHVTLMGADTLLSWNRSYYKKLCNQNFNKETCAKEYVFQGESIKAGLKGLVVTSMNADCSTCLGGIDLSKARSSIAVSAAMLVANRNHVEWLVNGFSSSANLTRTNVWRFTLASYNAGPGCFTQAFYDTRGYGNPLAWKDVSKRLNGACGGAVNYVAFMELVHTADPAVLLIASTDTSRAARMVLGPLATPTPVATITAIIEPTLEVTETPTVSSATEIPVTETPTASSVTETPVTETPTVGTTVTETSTVSSVTGTPATETPTVSSVTEMPATETPTVSSVTEIPVTETSIISSLTGTPTSTMAFVETSTEPPATTTPVPTDTLIPTDTATPIAQPTAFVPPVNANMGEIIVKFGGMVPGFLAESAVGAAGGEIQTQVDALGLTIVSAPQDQVSQVLASLQSNILVDYAEPNYAVQAFYTPNDPGYVDQTYLTAMQIPAAWDVTKGEGIIVAVIDTGVDIAHPDLAANILINSGEDGLDANGNDKRSNYVDDDHDGYVDNWMGWNFVNNNNDARDVNGHGTHSAGIIAAQMDNTLGISGIAPHARIMPIKALDDGGFGTYSQVAQAIIYAVDHGAKVINLGFGGTANSEILLAATNYAYDHNVIVVAAGGNTGVQTLIYPAANPNVIGVSAVDESLNVAVFSSYTNAIQVSAPGVGIYSTAPNGNYASMSGTSMAAAQVSGVVALLVTQPQFDTPAKVREALFNTALDLGAPGTDIYYGYGLAHAFDALGYGTTFPTATPSTGATPTNTPATPDPNANGGVNAMVQEELWASAQTSTCSLANNANSITSPAAFDGIVANCLFASGNDWTFTNFAPANTSYNSIHSIVMDVQMYFSGWADDTYQIEYSTDGTTWSNAFTFNTSNPPPTTLTLLSPSYTITTIHTPADVDNLQVRIINVDNGAHDPVTVYLDQIRLSVIKNTPPVITMPAAPAGSPFAKKTLITFDPVIVTDDYDTTPALAAALAANVEWYSNIDGFLHTGSSGFSTNNLTPGTHIITAQVTDSNGATGVGSITITILPNIGPHGGFTSTTDSCALCHRDHSAQGSAYLTNDPNSVTTSDAFCLKCHDGVTATKVSTHTNVGWGSPAEDPFEVRCIQCHDSHGTSNLFAIRTNIIANVNSGVTIAPKAFSSLTAGPNSFDDGDGSGLCVACHTTSPSSLVNHPGGASHSPSSTNDYAEKSCIFCHSHGSGFMPIRTALPPTQTP